MKRSFITSVAVMLIFAATVFAVEGDTLWTHTYGGANMDQAYSIIPAGDGGFLLAGNTLSFGAGAQDIYLVKINAQGDTLWTRTYGGSDWDGCNSIIASGDGGFLLAGWTESFGFGMTDVYLVKINAQGDTLWIRTYGGINDDLCQSIISSGDGGFLLAGWTLSFGYGWDDMYLIKIDVDGNIRWTRTYGGDYGDHANTIIPSNDGGFLLVGYTTSFGLGSADVYLVKINAQGDTLWTRTYGTTYWDAASSGISCSDSSFLIAGQTGDLPHEDMYVLKINDQGDTLWTGTYGGTSDDIASSVTPSSDGGFMLAGGTSSYGWGDMYLVKINTQGLPLWTRSYGGYSNDQAHQIILFGDGGFLLAGYTMSFGAGDADMYLVKVEGPPVAVEPSPKNQPNTFALYPPHPNPFNASTVASFELRVPSHVSLRVYNTAGRLVATLVDDFLQAGTHEVMFDGSGLASGIYLAKLQAGDFTTAQKLVLLK